MGRLLLALFVFGAVTKSDAAKILAVFPTPSISHQYVFRPLTQELAKRGHDVIVVTPDPAFPAGQTPANLTEIDVHNVSYTMWHEEMAKVAVGRESNINDQLAMFIHLFNTIFEQQLLSKELQEILNKKMHFDLILTEACVRPALILSHILKSPIIQISSFGPMLDANRIVGAPNHPIFQPIVVRQRLYSLTVWEKIREIYQQLRFDYIYYMHEQKENEMLRRIFGPDIPTLREMYNNVDMVFVNVHSIWNDNQPVPPNMIYLGGLHQTPEKDLPKDLKAYLDSSKNGVIYISFGTNVHPSILPPKKIKMMMNVLSQLPYDVIWKWETDIPDKPSNIRNLKWLPQSDLLRHPKLKLFITQGGLQSTDEAITAGVPLIGIPVIADQWFNTEKYVLHGIGKKLEMGTFTKEDFKNAIVTVIEDESYRNNIIRLRTLIRDQPQTPLERANWWVEHALRNGGARHLRSPTANMPWWEYYQVNILLIVLTILLCSIILVYASLSYINKFVVKIILHSKKLKVL